MKKLIHSYSTKRLELIATTLEHISSELKDPNYLFQLLNAEVSPEWPPGEYDRSAQEYFRDLLVKNGEDIVGWLGWYALIRATEKRPGILIAAGGYFGPPSESGKVEIGYSVIPSYRGKGYATEIVQALIDIAKQDTRVKSIIARTTDTNKASCIVLEKVGFKTNGLSDEENNIVYELIL